LTRCDSPLARLALAAALVAALGLAGCGRKGALDPPPGAAAEGPPPAQPVSGLAGAMRPPVPGQTTAMPVENTEVAFDAQGNPIAGKSQRQRFFLDFLLE
jgi:predicted small lipoprotein YifL